MRKDQAILAKILGLLPSVGARAQQAVLKPKIPKGSIWFLSPH